MARCEHNKNRSRCRLCNGGSYCEHSRIRTVCSICSPESTYNQYKRRADKRRLVFTLSSDEFKRIVEQACVFCGELNEPRGVDRRNNDIGYVFSNCQSCCWPCNELKRNWTEHEFLSHVHRIEEHQNQLKARQARLAKQEKQNTKPLAQVPPTPSSREHRADLSPEALRWLNSGIKPNCL
jgi:hypothetical protein